MRWVIEKFPNDKTPCLSVQVSMRSRRRRVLRAPSSLKPSADVAAANRRVQLQELVDITASFRVQGASVSGVKVEALQVREKYKPTQGVRYHTRSGTVVVRT